MRVQLPVESLSSLAGIRTDTHLDAYPMPVENRLFPSGIV